MANCCKGSTKQVEELILENKELKAKIKKLCTENTKLQQKISRLKDLIEKKIATATEKACIPLTKRITALESENERKDTEISRLKAQANKDSSTSSKRIRKNKHFLY